MKDEARLKELQWAIHGVKAPFSSAGSFVPEKPLTLVFRDKSRFTVERAENSYEQVKALQPLIDRCKPATFGDKRRTRFDRRVRDAVQLNADYGGFSIEHFDPEAAGILDAIQRQMLPGNSAPIRAELYSLTVSSLKAALSAILAVTCTTRMPAFKQNRSRLTSARRTC